MHATLSRNGPVLSRSQGEVVTPSTHDSTALSQNDIEMVGNVKRFASIHAVSAQ